MHRNPFLVALLLLTAPLAGAESDPPVRVEEIRFRSGDVELAGRLWLPATPGPHPAAVFLPGSGGSIRDLDRDPDPLPFRYVARGIAFFAWDKRGVRDSGGVFAPLPDSGEAAQLAHLRLLAGDAAAAMRHLGGRDDIDAERIGAFAFSQGGWVASQLEAVGARPRFLVVAGGPAVSIGEENRYSEIAGAAKQASRDGKGPVGLDEVYARLETLRGEGVDFGGFDPLACFEATATPTLFLLGELDLSVPTRRSAERLSEIGRRNERVDHYVLRGGNHGLAKVDAAGQWYLPAEYYATQFEFLGNLGVLGERARVEVVIDREVR